MFVKNNGHKMAQCRAVGNYRREACNVTDWNEKMTVGQSRSEEASKRNIGLESARSQKERKTEANLEKDRFGGSRKMR